MRTRGQDIAYDAIHEGMTEHEIAEAIDKAIKDCVEAAKVSQQPDEAPLDEAAIIAELEKNYMYLSNPLTGNERALVSHIVKLCRRAPKREIGHLKYLEDWHYVTQSLIGTVDLYLSKGDYEKAKQRMAHYKALLPKLSTTDVEVEEG